jgi:hypothetical protein
MRSLLLVAVFTLASCGGPLADAEGQFHKGQYPAAHQALLALESASRCWSTTDRATYALYRGLTLLALGDRGRAAMWLFEAKVVEDERPGSLSGSDARRLGIAMQSNGIP